jgi:hypothetical protein
MKKSEKRVTSTKAGADFFCTLKLGEFARAVHFDPRAKYLDLIRVHGGVGNENLRVLETFRTVDAYHLIENEA